MTMAHTITLKEDPAAYAVAVEQVQTTGEPLVIEQDGKPIAVVLPYAEYEQLVALREAERKQAWQEEQQRILAQEQAAFERMKPELLKTHQGKFVAIHNGQLVDYDDNEAALAKRVYTKFGYRTILIAPVTETPRVYHINSPRLVR
jgi:prevent-host-death family protein